MAVCATWAIMTILFAFLICLPLDYNWKMFSLKPTSGNCGNLLSGFTAVGVVDILTDLSILILPLPMIWRLQLPNRNKMALAIILGLGIL